VRQALVGDGAARRRGRRGAHAGAGGDAGGRYGGGGGRGSVRVLLGELARGGQGAVLVARCVDGR
jgi:hypothetical protein